MATPLIVSEVSKSFTMHLRGGLVLPVVSNVSFSVASGECVVLGGPSGIGKSSVLKMLYGNYAVDHGQILVNHAGRIVDIASADPAIKVGLQSALARYLDEAQHLGDAIDAYRALLDLQVQQDWLEPQEHRIFLQYSSMLTQLKSSKFIRTVS